MLFEGFVYICGVFFFCFFGKKNRPLCFITIYLTQMSIEINGIDYELEKMKDLAYVLEKAYEYVQKIGWERATASQKFIRHIHIYIALSLVEIGIPEDNIQFETKLQNKNVDLCIFKDKKPFLVISIKSQSSSIRKNFTNSANALQGEAASLKSSYSDLKVATFMLYKETDVVENVNCKNYYIEKILLKVLPIIVPMYNSPQKFDNGCLVLWDNTATGIQIEETNTLFKEFGVIPFFAWIKNVYEGKEITSQFSAKDISTKIADFLTDEKIG